MQIWELDYYSRPILDESGKKVWELLVCQSPLRFDDEPADLFRYAEYCPHSQVNSLWLKAAIERAIAQAPQPPDKIRFFRQAMTNMITKACDDLTIPAQLSRRTPALNQWLQQRQAEVYPQESGYQPGSNPTVSFPETPVQSLPDALMGEKWQFVSLEAVAFNEMGDWSITFGESFPLSLASLEPNALVPGLLIFSTRALPLAAWISGLELSSVSFSEGQPARLLLETGVSDRWALASLSKPELQAEARQFEVAKQKANGVHFVAVQVNPEAEAFAGFWLLPGINLA